MIRRPFLAPELPTSVAFVLAQAADLLTWCAFRPVELNPVVVGMGLGAVLAKLGLMASVVFVAWAIGRPWGRMILCLGIIAGVVGALSNVPPLYLSR